MTVREQVTEIIAGHFGVSPSDVTDGKSFEADFGADSLDQVELVMELEDHFGITIGDEVVDHLVKVENAVTYCENKVAGNC